MRGKWRAQRADRGAHAARGFVGGAAALRASPSVESSKVSMPHAALWVVQPHDKDLMVVGLNVSMPHAALWVVQHRSQLEWVLGSCFNAARGFVGGATKSDSFKHVLDHFVSMPHAALWVVQLYSMCTCINRLNGFNAARGFVGGATKLRAVIHREGCSFNAARGFVGGATRYRFAVLVCHRRCFNAARGFVGGATGEEPQFGSGVLLVSMPHAALWVVQLHRSQPLSP